MPDGVYLCEDLHTSYWRRWGGGYKRRGTFIEYSKNFIDKLNAWHSEEASFKACSFTTTVKAIHYYDSIIVIEKKPITKPFSSRTGKIEIPEVFLPELNGFNAYMARKKRNFRRRMNKLTSFLKLPWKNGELDY